MLSSWEKEFVTCCGYSLCVFQEELGGGIFKLIGSSWTIDTSNEIKNFRDSETKETKFITDDMQY